MTSKSSAIIFSTFIIFLVTTSSNLPLFSAAQTCELRSINSTTDITNNNKSCYPFNTSLPPFPFSTSPGCGHPSFQLHNCSPSSSLLRLNNLSFSLLGYDPPSSSLTLSPLSTTTCGAFPFIPPRPMNFSNTPFRISDSFCSRLSLLKPCSILPLPNCSRCSWHCALFKDPLRVAPDCGHGPGPGSQPVSEQGCHNDVLGYLDNVLKEGIVVDFDRNDDEFFSKCEGCRSNKDGVCGFNTSDPNTPFLCFEQSPASQSLWIRHRRRIAEFTTMFVLLCLVFFVAISFFLFRNWKLSADDVNPEDPMTLFLHNHRSAAPLLPPVFTYEELESSTNRFDPDRKLGDGGFGSVFLGKLFDGRTVAVKYLHRNGGKAVSTKAFCNEILILSSIDHANLVKLHGYCSDPRGLLLVYDYIPNGTLADHIHGPNRKSSGPLGWATRVDIALQIAIAVEYLHFTVQPPVVHRDITTSNIFVDQSMRVRVGDFGLSRLLVCPEKSLSGELLGSSSGCVWTGPQGTPGYLDPDYHKSFRLTEKSDVYSFGVVLLELITGLKAVDQKREKREVGLVDMVVARIQLGLLDQVVDPTLAAEGPIVVESVAAVAELAFRCVAADKDDRPDAREVVAELRRIWSRIRGVRGSNASVVVVPAAEE